MEQIPYNSRMEKKYIDIQTFRITNDRILLHFNFGRSGSHFCRPGDGILSSHAVMLLVLKGNAKLLLIYATIS